MTAHSRMCTDLDCRDAAHDGQCQCIHDSRYHVFHILEYGSDELLVRCGGASVAECADGCGSRVCEQCQ